MKSRMTQSKSCCRRLSNVLPNITGRDVCGNFNVDESKSCYKCTIDVNKSKRTHKHTISLLRNTSTSRCTCSNPTPVLCVDESKMCTKTTPSTPKVTTQTVNVVNQSRDKHAGEYTSTPRQAAVTTDT